MSRGGMSRPALARLRKLEDERRFIAGTLSACHDIRRMNSGRTRQSHGLKGNSNRPGRSDRDLGILSGKQTRWFPWTSAGHRAALPEQVDGVDDEQCEYGGSRHAADHRHRDVAHGPAAGAGSHSVAIATGLYSSEALKFRGRTASPERSVAGAPVGSLLEEFLTCRFNRSDVRSPSASSPRANPVG